MADIKNIAEKTRQLLLNAGAQKAQYTVTEKEKHEFNVDPASPRQKIPPSPL